MTWRRFLALLRGLSPQSASVAAASSRQQHGVGDEKANVIDSPSDAQAAFVALFGRGKPAA